MLRRLAVAVLALNASCGGGDGSGPADAPPIEGAWTFFETLADADGNQRCHDEGRLDLLTDGPLVSGYVSQQGACTGPGGPLILFGDSLRRVQASDASITFTFGGCSFQAHLFAAPPDSMSGTINCPVTDGRATAFTGTWFAGRGVDEVSPSVSGTQLPPAGDTLFVPKDTFRLTVTAEDDRMLLWVGYRLGAPVSLQDSTRVVARSGQSSFELAAAIPPAWLGDTPLTLFARDAFDRLTEQPSGVLRVYDLVRRPLRTGLLGASAVDAEYDAKRSLVYLLEPSPGRVAVLRLSDLALGTAIPLPAELPAKTGLGVDLSPTGDSLLVAISSPPALHVVDLADGSPSDLPIADAAVLGDVTVAAGRAFVYGERDSAGFITGRLWEIDLATRAQQLRTDVGGTGGGSLGLGTEFATSGDGSHLLLVDTPVRCMQLFSAATGFGSCAVPPAALSFLPSGSRDGLTWLVRHNLYDAGLAVAATPVAEGTPAGVLAPDASIAYFPTPLGIDVLELPSGTVREHIRVPVAVGRLTLLPEAERIAIWTDGAFGGDGHSMDRITVMDLR
jgi:hypothetical protein